MNLCGGAPKLEENDKEEIKEVVRETIRDQGGFRKPNFVSMADAPLVELTESELRPYLKFVLSAIDYAARVKYEGARSQFLVRLIGHMTPYTNYIELTFDDSRAEKKYTEIGFEVIYKWFHQTIMVAMKTKGLERMMP